MNESEKEYLLKLLRSLQYAYHSECENYLEDGEETSEMLEIAISKYVDFLLMRCNN